MSIAFLSWVFEHSLATGPARLVLLALAERADDAGRSWPSIADLCRRARMSRSAVHRALTRLVSLGELEMSVVRGRSRTNSFVIKRTGNGTFCGDKTSHQRDVLGRKTYRKRDVLARKTYHFCTENVPLVVPKPSGTMHTLGGGILHRALTECGVDAAAALIAAHGADRVWAVLDRVVQDVRAGATIGPAWIVAALRDGYRCGDRSMSDNDVAEALGVDLAEFRDCRPVAQSGVSTVHPDAPDAMARPFREKSGRSRRDHEPAPD